jgi:hypothetical protein
MHLKSFRFRVSFPQINPSPPSLCSLPLESPLHSPTLFRPLRPSRLLRRCYTIIFSILSQFLSLFQVAYMCVCVCVCVRFLIYILLIVWFLLEFLSRLISTLFGFSFIILVLDRNMKFDCVDFNSA